MQNKLSTAKTSKSKNVSLKVHEYLYPKVVAAFCLINLSMICPRMGGGVVWGGGQPMEN